MALTARSDLITFNRLEQIGHDKSQQALYNSLLYLHYSILTIRSLLFRLLKTGGTGQLNYIGDYRYTCTGTDYWQYTRTGTGYYWLLPAQALYWYRSYGTAVLLYCTTS